MAGADGLDVPVEGLDVPMDRLDVPMDCLDVPMGCLDVPTDVLDVLVDAWGRRLRRARRWLRVRASWPTACWLYQQALKSLSHDLCR